MTINLLNKTSLLVVCCIAFCLAFLTSAATVEAALIYSADPVEPPFNYRLSTLPNPDRCYKQNYIDDVYIDSETGQEVSRTRRTGSYEERSVSISFCSHLYPPPPPSGSCWVSASPSQTSGANGQSVTISWGSSGDVTNLTGNFSHGLSGSKTYTLKAANIGVHGYASNGTKLCQDAVYVTYTAPPAPPACRNNIDDDGDGFTDYDGNGGVPDPGCTHSNDTNEYNPPTSCNLSASPNPVNEGSTTTFTWSASGGAAESVTVAGVPDEDLSGSMDLAMNNDGLIPVTLEVFSEDSGAGSLVCSDTINVTVNPGPPQCSDGEDNDGDGLIDFGTDPLNETVVTGCIDGSDDDEQPAPPTPSLVVTGPSSIVEGGDTTLTWGTNGHLGTCTIDQGVGVVSGSESSVVSPNSDTTYTISCDDTGSDYEDPYTVSDSDSVTVTPSTECNDGVDNDLDNRIDHPSDSGCTSESDDNETSSSQTPSCDIRGQSWFIPGTPVSLEYATYGGAPVNDMRTGRLVMYDGSYGGYNSLAINRDTNAQYQDVDYLIDEDDVYSRWSADGYMPSPRVMGSGDNRYVNLQMYLYYRLSGISRRVMCDTHRLDIVTSDPNATPPEISLTASAPLIRSGEIVNIEWDPNGFVGTCTLSPALKFTGADTSINDNQDITLSSKQTIVYECTGDYGGIVTVQASTTVNVLPKIFES